ncbi:hypothetical protein CBL_01383 [Carabus blaptoides fortunei]
MSSSRRTSGTSPTPSPSNIQSSSAAQSPKPSTSATPVSILKSPSTSPGAKSPRPSGSKTPRVSIGTTPGTSKTPTKLMECPACPDVGETSTKEKEPVEKYQAVKPDAVNTEYLYYSSAIREMGPALTNEIDRQLIIPWVRKLFRPEYNSSLLRDKRNKYLLYLTLTILNDEVYGIFKTPPPDGALSELADLYEEFPQAEWEQDRLWEEILEKIPEEFQLMKCSVHTDLTDCNNDRDESGMFYDEEFKFLLYLARPYVTLMKKGKDSTRAAGWLQKLCTIQDKSCTSMKQLRNDYMRSLIGYLQDLRLVGLFKTFPMLKSLPPLEEFASSGRKNRSPLHPNSEETAEFLAAQHIPNEGAFCYVAITGELLESTLQQLD